MADLSQPLLSQREENKPIDHSPESGRKDTKALFAPDADDIPPINTTRDFYREFCIELKKLWYLAAPAVFTSVCQYSFGAITQLFAGQVSTIALAAVSVENSVIAGFSFGIMARTLSPFSPIIYKKLNSSLIIFQPNSLVFYLLFQKNQI